MVRHRVALRIWVAGVGRQAFIVRQFWVQADEEIVVLEVR